ncbi:Six-hairpin glycosidase-like protein [Naematelia encephala]|uniref:Trehalase n=1 Tax=Naematelia encephala TaxID=71784 RepID=A0A1Y2BLV3_9TREE|nr:Six-hairpin glycosidase-like protein [Naematelia encephala]
MFSKMLLALVTFLASVAVAQTGTQTSLSSFSPTPVSTSVPSPTVPLNSTVIGQGIYPPAQGWCNSGQPDVFCPGVLLQDVELSGIFADSKTFPDKPTVGTLNETLAAFAKLPSNVTVGDIETFVEQYFKGEGLELSQVALQGFNSTPAVLDTVNDPIYKAWVSVVNGYWTLLIRETNQSALCNGQCESSLIPLNHTIVVPGGRYRETYYWDTFWIIEGLLKSQLYTYAWDVIQNFMDLVDVYGFVPNGGRKYYLDRSQPPVFVQMVDAYLKVTGNVTILERALPAMENELEWWRTNRSISVKSPYSGQNLTVYHYSVNNSAPRPEGYVEDYTTAFGASPALNESARAALYAELATGAETGWDYSSRWCKQPVINVSDNNPALRTLNTRAVVPVDLMSLLAGDHALLANMYEIYSNSSNTTTSSNSSVSNSTSKATYHRSVAKNLTSAILDLHWDPVKSWFYDFNTTANARSSVYTPAGTFALWQNITPPELDGRNESAALGIVSGQRYLLGRYSGIPSVASLLVTGLNWDFPNSWPPHVYSSIKAFETLSRLYPNASILTNDTLSFADVATGQFGLNETDLPPQSSSTLGNVTLQTQEAKGKPWPLALSIEFANRYMAAAFCSWYSTGGEINGTLTQLPLSDLNSTGTFTTGQTGVMFEKFNATDTDAAGGGGEYTVQIGFGWTNGVVLWTAGEYGQYLPSPSCPLIPIIEIQGGKNETVYQNGTTVAGSNATTSSLYAGFRIPRA